MIKATLKGRNANISKIKLTAVQHQLALMGNEANVTLAGLS